VTSWSRVTSSDEGAAWALLNSVVVKSMQSSRATASIGRKGPTFSVLKSIHLSGHVVLIAMVQLQRRRLAPASAAICRLPSTPSARWSSARPHALTACKLLKHDTQSGKPEPGHQPAPDGRPRIPSLSRFGGSHRRWTAADAARPVVRHEWIGVRRFVPADPGPAPEPTALGRSQVQRSSCRPPGPRPDREASGRLSPVAAALAGPWIPSAISSSRAFAVPLDARAVRMPHNRQS
jgi:hypothetical protein